MSRKGNKLQPGIERKKGFTGRKQSSWNSSAVITCSWWTGDWASGSRYKGTRQNQQGQEMIPQ